MDMMLDGEVVLSAPDVVWEIVVGEYFGQAVDAQEAQSLLRTPTIVPVFLLERTLLDEMPSYRDAVRAIRDEFNMPIEDALAQMEQIGAVLSSAMRRDKALMVKPS